MSSLQPSVVQMKWTWTLGKTGLDESILMILIFWPLPSQSSSCCKLNLMIVYPQTLVVSHAAEPLL
uniref:Uncharacterized protein n=1 Tax=Arundo donax TaxID=35708 RepID=A0A0A9E577_ARUDO